MVKKSLESLKVLKHQLVKQGDNLTEEQKSIIVMEALTQFSIAEKGMEQLNTNEGELLEGFDAMKAVEDVTFQL